MVGKRVRWIMDLDLNTIWCFFFISSVWTPITVSFQLFKRTIKISHTWSHILTTALPLLFPPQRRCWSTRTTWWTSDSSTARLTLTGCPTSWTFSPGPCRSSGRKVSAHRDIWWKENMEYEQFHQMHRWLVMNIQSPESVMKMEHSTHCSVVN